MSLVAFKVATVLQVFSTSHLDDLTTAGLYFNT